MHLRFGFAAAALAAIFALPTAAQDMERIIVTANRIDTDDMRAAPAVYRQIPADFVLVSVSYQSATRDTGERRKELETMFNRLKARAAKTDGFSLSGGTVGESTADIDTVLFGDVYSADYSGTGRFTLTLNIDTRKDESFEALMKRAEAFVDSVEITGRAEAYMGDEQFIGARDVAKHRADLMTDIATEVSNWRGKFGGLTGTKVVLTGLESRIVTQPSGPLELEIFIPYTLTLEAGSD
ncbi:hypothetical protein K1X12_00020 [Hyphomonas sp. WL0036]|uniref:hypothetical protein n=1 Tax=Hyphomonas sediminis TaxID=2866160 RepID=UPI001C80BB22|nr:hypothetical protein [Hyphomonas sediminis]MBY9065259.1 hypothetical protein [Hyphomonas sediminis]